MFELKERNYVNNGAVILEKSPAAMLNTVCVQKYL